MKKLSRGMIMTEIEMTEIEKYKTIKDDIFDIQFLDSVEIEIEELRESLREIVKKMGASWCSTLTGYHVNYFFNFCNNDKIFKQWTSERIFKIYRIILEEFEELKELENEINKKNNI
jgi:predicted metallo-beta-lactamase superfamily hydrolase